MASVVRDGDGRHRVEFYWVDGGRRRVRLGRSSKTIAQNFASHVHQIVAHTSAGMALPPAEQTWLAKLSDTYFNRLASQLDWPTRHEFTLKLLLDVAVERRTGIEPSSLRKLRQTANKLRDYFGEDRSIKTIDCAAMDKWVDELASTQNLAEGSIRGHCANAKQIFRVAVTMKWLDDSPASHLVGGTTPRVDIAYVSRDDVRKVIAHLADTELRVRLAMCRFAGCRVDSEPTTIPWTNVDWERRQILAFSKKTKRFLNKRYRPLIIDDDLMPILREAFLKRDSDDATICGYGTLNGWHKDLINAAIEAAGLKRWPALFQSLRSSYDTEMRGLLPEYAVDRITGHSAAVARKHYNQILPPDVIEAAIKPFARAAVDHSVDRKRAG